MRDCTKLFGKGRYSKYAKMLSKKNVIALIFGTENYQYQKLPKMFSVVFSSFWYLVPPHHNNKILIK